MALLLPTTTDPNILKNNSYAESKIIRLINNLDKEKTKDWVIYYSYYFKGRINKYSDKHTYIKNHNEVDFLILAPGKGIFVFEIKGGIISYTPYGGWFAMNRMSKQRFRIDPYNQAKENYYGIANIMGNIYCPHRKRYLRFDKFVGGTLVGFPDISEIPNSGLESDRFDTFVDGMDLYDFILRNAFNHAARNDGKVVPTVDDINCVIKKLKGMNFTYSYNELDYIKSINLRIKDLTQEQLTIFKGLLDNKRCLVKGGAGTGKTVLCEFLYKYLSINEKKNVLYLTYNKQIANKIKGDLNTSNGSNCCCLKEYIRNDSLVYDALILDEAQDINNDPEIIDLLDKSIKGGLKNGMCYLFFDDNQRIIKRKNSKIFENQIFYDDFYRYALFTLTLNCRNGKGIKDSLNVLFDEEIDSKDLSEVKDLITNEEVKYFESDNYVEITKNIIHLINDLNNKGISNKSITLLFNYNPKNDKNNIYEELQKFYKDELVLYDYNNTNKLTFSSVSKFKGLENDIIIYINDKDHSKLEDHYVALSRAKVLAYVYKLL